jgi:vancomycin resistance protein YoaR
LSVRAHTGVLGARRRLAPSRAFWLAGAAAALVLASLGVLAGAVFAGSPTRITEGVRVAGVDVGGLTPAEARSLLERRADAYQHVPVLFFAGEQSWKVTPHRLGVDADWAAAVDAARRQGEGFGPFRGLRRVKVRVFGADIAPPAKVYSPALDYELRQLSSAIDRSHREAAIVLKDTKPILIPGRAGRRLDRERAAATMVGALASLSRSPIALPVKLDQPSVTPADLEPVVEQARTALSAPIRLQLGKTWWRLRPARIAELLALPHDGSRTLDIGGPGADAWFARFSMRAGNPPVDADFAISSSGRVTVVPGKDGLVVDVDATRNAILRAVLAPAGRRANVVVVSQAPKRTTSEAQAMGITGLVGAYETIYGGDPNRIHNVQLVSQLIDKTLIAPGTTFSFNGTTGERTPEKGFREAPVIINGELQNGLGGGICQVSTTVFNAAYEAGLRITQRNNHALYISHYPLGRDATVNYPDLDLEFVNDTGRWLLLRTFVGSSSLTVGLYGTPANRRVETETAPLRVTGGPPVTRVKDPTLPAGEQVVEESGEPSRATSVHRRVYAADGKLLYDDVWYSSYRGEKRVVRVGTKKAEPEKPEKPAKPAPPMDDVPAETPPPPPPKPPEP